MDNPFGQHCIILVFTLDLSMLFFSSFLGEVSILLKISRVISALICRSSILGTQNKKVHEFNRGFQDTGSFFCSFIATDIFCKSSLSNRKIYISQFQVCVYVKAALSVL